MEIVKFRKKNRNQYTVLLSDHTSLSFYDDTIIHYNLLSKKKINEAMWKEICAYNSRIDAYFKALKEISTKLRTEKELKEKLKKKGYTTESITYAIEKLKTQGYLNEELYIKSFIADQINLTLKGPKKILLELKNLGFEEEKVCQFLEFEDEIWQKKIEKIIEKKCKSSHNQSMKMFQNKIKKDLINLGYELHLIEEAIANINTFDETEILEKEMNKEYRKLSRKYQGEELNKKLKYKLYVKGFSLEDINLIIDKNID